MSISSEITRISGNVSAALTAIGAKGVTVPSGSNSDDLASLIAQIESGGGGITTETVMDATITATDQDTSGYVAWVKTQWYDYMSETLVDDTNYIVTIDGTPYLCHANAVYGGGDIYCGDTEIVWGTPANSIYPFAIGSYANGNVQWMIGDNQSHSVKVERVISMSDSTTLITKTITTNGTYSAEDDDADGYSEVTVNVPTGSSKNIQTAQTTDRRNNTALGSIISLTCSTAGTYDVYWTCARSNTSQTWGSQLYINGSAYGTENTSWSNNVQNNHLTGVTIPANATVAVYGRSRSGYYIYVPQLTIVQTA